MRTWVPVNFRNCFFTSTSYLRLSASFHPPISLYLQPWMVAFILSSLIPCVSMFTASERKEKWKKKTSRWICLSPVMPHLLLWSPVPITPKSSGCDLCRLCSWHRFRAVSREPAGCFTLQINPDYWWESAWEAGGAGMRTPSPARRRLVIHHNLTTLVLTLLPSGDESFLSRSGYPSACDIDCCHIILYKAIMIHDRLKERSAQVAFFWTDLNSKWVCPLLRTEHTLCFSVSECLSKQRRFLQNNTALCISMAAKFICCWKLK